LYLRSAEKPFKLNNFCPMPKTLLGMALPGTAKLIYAMLLDRVTLSEKNDLTDTQGRIYVYYAAENLAQELHVSVNCVEKNLSVLRKAGLIRTMREKGRLYSRIYVRIPVETVEQAEKTVSRPKKQTRQQKSKSYDCKPEESL